VDAVAMREKHLGIWRAVTWRQYGERARRAGLGLVALGLQPRDVVSIIADNSPEWLYTDMGTLCVGGVTNGIYTTDAPRQVEYIVNDSGTRFLFAGDEEQLDKVLEVRARCPQRSTTPSIPAPGMRWSRSRSPKTWRPSSIPPARRDRPRARC
jgi:long-chain acyl-CoA synthetase